MMPEDGLDTLGAWDESTWAPSAGPTVPDHLSHWGLLLPIRRTFDHYVNLRPARLLRGVKRFLNAGAPVLAALEETLASGTKTSDLGGTATTEEMADAVVQRLTDHA